MAVILSSSVGDGIHVGASETICLRPNTTVAEIHAVAADLGEQRLLWSAVHY